MPPAAARRGAVRRSCAQIAAGPAQRSIEQRVREVVLDLHATRDGLVQRCPNLAVSQQTLFACPAAAGALPEAREQRVAQAVSQRLDRMGHVPLRAQDCRGGCNSWEGQALGVR